MKVVIFGKTSFTSRKSGKPCYLLAIGSRNDFWQGYKIDQKFVNEDIYNRAPVTSECEVFFDIRGNIDSITPLK